MEEGADLDKNHLLTSDGDIFRLSKDEDSAPHLPPNPPLETMESNVTHSLESYLNAKSEASSFFGFCIASGTAHKVCVQEQCLAYLDTLPHSSPPTRNLAHSFRFGHSVHDCLYPSPVTISLPDASVMHFEVAGIDLKVPFLLVVDVLRKYEVALGFGTGYMRPRSQRGSYRFITQATMPSSVHPPRAVSSGVRIN